MLSEKHSVIGQMSGTSLDGMDLGLFLFWKEEGQWKFEIVVAETISYTAEWKNELSESQKKTAAELIHLDRVYGKWVGEEIKSFCKRHKVKAQMAGCHGHTVWHQPKNGFTLQIGHGGDIAMHSELTIVNDFRSQDVALGGQGAPLVPIGDVLLFPEMKWCLNIGGIANLTNKSYEMAFDICPANILLNHFAQKLGMEFDRDGANARNGKVISELLNSWLSLPYFSAAAPKSLGREWVDENILNENLEHYTPEDLLATSLELSAHFIGKSLKPLGPKGIVTGGGAHNTYLMERIEFHCGFEISPAESKVIDYKEALIFAFMGLLRHLNIVNELSKYTGSARDHSAGAVWLP